jgi:hypothetical protein
MKNQELFDIMDGDKVLYKDLTQDEYFDTVEDLAKDFYENGYINPKDLKTVIKKVEN